jgi:creatine kinase
VESEKQVVVKEFGDFPSTECPAQMPDLSQHQNMMAEYLREHPSVYYNLKDKKTENGVGLAKCIKTGVDNKGHPHIKTCGLVAGDEESYTLFKDIFDPVISARHNGYLPDAKHPTDMDVSKISNTKIDPTGKYVITSRCRTGRSVRPFPFPPSCNFEQRRALEKIIVKGLNKLSGELKGEYFGLHGSESMPDRAMGIAKEEELRANGKRKFSGLDFLDFLDFPYFSNDGKFNLTSEIQNLSK